MKLTSRQKAFLSQALDLYQELRRPFHYSEIAQRLGLSSFTAYDMLRVLEGRGLVRSQYMLKETSGPGRARIRFSPTARAMEILHHLAGNAADQEEWEKAKARVLTRLRQRKTSDCRDLAQDLLSRVPEARSPLVFCAQVIAALLISVREIKHRLGKHGPIAMLLSTPPSRLGLGLLAGLALGLILIDQFYHQTFGNFQSLIERYELSLQQLSPENLEQLQDFTREVATALEVRAD